MASFKAIHCFLALLFLGFNMIFGNEVTNMYPTGLNSNSSYGQIMVAYENMLVVSAPSLSTSDAYGAAFIYNCTAASTCNTTQVIYSPTDSNTGFASAIAVDNDTLVIGAPGWSKSQGAVYIYSCDGNLTCSQEFNLTLSNSSNNEAFGYALAVQSNKLLVGAPGKNQGYAYLYSCNLTNCTLESVLTPNNNSIRNFGYSVAMEGPMVVVGTGPQNKTVGEAYVYDCSLPANCTLVSTLLPKSNVGKNAHWGNALVVSDGMVYIGADNLNKNQGGVFLYDCSSAFPTINTNATTSSNITTIFNSTTPSANSTASNANCSLVATLVVNNRVVANIQFGSSIAVYNNTLVIGAQNQIGGGKSYLYVCTNRTYCNMTAVLTESVSLVGDDFGASAAASANFIAIGSPLRNSGQGEVYLYNLNTTTSLPGIEQIPKATTQLPNNSTSTGSNSQS